MARAHLMADGAVELADVQGLLYTGYGNLEQACFLLLRVSNAGAARDWLARVSVTNASERNVTRALQVALSPRGMRALGAEESVVSRFAAEFVSGMTGLEGRSRRLGDTGANAPQHWRWGGQTTPDLLVMLYAASDLAGWRESALGEFFASGFEIIRILETSNMHGFEPFGFADGVSQPGVDWGNTRTPGTVADTEYGNLIAPGDFVLGYRNEYGLYTERPLLGTDEPGAAILPEAVDDPTRHDLGRNGTYLVLRELHQDVRGFWQFVAENIRDGETVPGLAEEMIGRRMSGEPIVPARERAVRGVGPDPVDIRQNQFDYAADPAGLRCPIGAHVRRANPRTGDMPPGEHDAIARLCRTLGIFRPDLRDDLVASSRFHRIIRRGREFGMALPWQEALAPDAPDPKSGLQFMCLNGNISRQFEFIQNAWLMSAAFAGLGGESDPISGTRAEFPEGHPTDGFSIPQPDGIARRLGAVQRFVTVAGGGYFFLPGIRALRYFATVGA